MNMGLDVFPLLAKDARNGAPGNKVEETVSGTTHEYVSAFGVSAQMTGQTENATLVSLLGGVQAIYSTGTLRRFRFPDWQGTIRAESEPAGRTFSESLAFAPFGERYALKGTPYNVDSFTGKPDQLVSDEYDFPAREEHNAQGRWVSPDPMRGTGNKYVYADNNPLSNVDVYGLFVRARQEDPDMAAWLAAEENQPDPLIEAEHGNPLAGPSTAAVAMGEDAYLKHVDESFSESGEVAEETPPRLQRTQADASQQQGQPEQQQQNLTGTFTILGQSVPYTIAGTGQAAQDSLGTMNASVAAINQAEEQLAPTQVSEIKAVKAIYVVADMANPGGYSVTGPSTQRWVSQNLHIDVKVGTFILNEKTLPQVSAGYWASGFAHEGTHIINHDPGGSVMRESRAYHEQYQTASAFHLSPNEVAFIKERCGSSCN